MKEFLTTMVFIVVFTLALIVEAYIIDDYWTREVIKRGCAQYGVNPETGETKLEWNHGKM